MTVVLAGVMPAVAEAEELVPVKLSLQGAIASALARNFALRIEQQQPVIAAGQLDAARGAYSPTVSLGVERTHDDSPATGDSASTGNTTTATAGLSGLLPTGATYSVAANLASSSGAQTTAATQGAFTSYDAAQGTLALIEITQPLLQNRRLDSARVAMREGELALRSAGLAAQQQALETVAAVEVAYFDLLAAHQTVRVNESALALAGQSLADTRDRIAVGSLSPLDEQDARALVASSRADLLVARQALREAENALLTLVTDDFTTARTAGIEPTDALAQDEVAVDYGASLGRALAHRPELPVLSLAVEQQELAVDLQRNQSLPALNLVGSYALQGADDSTSGVWRQWRDADHPYYTVGVTVSFPWSQRANRGKLSAARAQEEQARLQLAQAREGIMSAVDGAIAAVRTSAARIDATREAGAYAAAALDAEREKLARGTSTSFTVLQLQRNLVAAQADEIQAVADYNKALANLRLQEGTSLLFWRIDYAPAATAATGS